MPAGGGPSLLAQACPAPAHLPTPALQCGSCWAYAATAAIEAKALIGLGRKFADYALDLSEQHLVDCANNQSQSGYDSAGCQGGYLSDALLFATRRVRAASSGRACPRGPHARLRVCIHVCTPARRCVPGSARRSARQRAGQELNPCASRRAASQPGAAPCTRRSTPSYPAPPRPAAAKSRPAAPLGPQELCDKRGFVPIHQLCHGSGRRLRPRPSGARRLGRQGAAHRRRLPDAAAVVRHRPAAGARGGGGGRRAGGARGARPLLESGLGTFTCWALSR